MAAFYWRHFGMDVFDVRCWSRSLNKSTSYGVVMLSVKDDVVFSHELVVTPLIRMPQRMRDVLILPLVFDRRKFFTRNFCIFVTY